MFNSVPIIRYKNRSQSAVSSLLRQTSVLCLALLLVFVSMQVAFAQTVTPNPNFQGVCNTNIVFILDASKSIDDQSSVDTVRNAASGFISSLNGTGSQVAIVEFATTADIPIGYTLIDQNNIDNVFTPYLSNSGTGHNGKRYFDDRLGTHTNWEDAFLKTDSLAPPNLVIFMTDGNPNTVGNGPEGNAWGAALAPAKVVANTIKSEGSHIFALGIGTGVNVTNLREVTDGANSTALTTNPNNFATADYFTGEFSEIETALSEIILGLCGGTINVTKLIDADGDLNTANDQTTAPNWTFTVNATAPAASTPISSTTDQNGIAAFNIDFGGNITATADVVETPQNGFQILDAQCTGGLSNGTFNANSSSVTGVQLDSDAMVTCTFINANATINLDMAKTGTLNLGVDGIANVGDVISYTIVATNTGNVALTGVTISDPVAEPLTCNPAIPATLVPNAILSCTGSYMLTQADIDAGRKDNVATTTSNETDPITATHSEPIPQVPNINLTKGHELTIDADSDGNADVGDQVTYVFTTTNRGNVTLTNVTIVDNTPLPGLGAITCANTVPGNTGFSNGTGVLAPGESVICRATYTILQADAEAGLVTNSADAFGTPPVGNPVSDNDTDVVNVPQEPSVIINKTLLSNADEDGSTSVSLNDTLTYQFVVTNTGRVTLNTVTVTDPMVGLSPVDCGGGSNVIATLAPGATATCTATYVVTQADVDAGQITNTATVTARDPNNQPVPPNNSSEIVNVPQIISLGLQKAFRANADEDGSQSVSRNDTLTYVFTTTNTGNVTLNGVTITDPLPGLSALTCGTTSKGDAFANDGTDTLDPAESVACTATYVVTQNDVEAGQINNTATANGMGPNQTPVSAQDTANVPVAQTPALAIDKVLAANADEDGSQSVSRNDTLTYVFTTTNTGNVTLNSVTITDPLPGLSALTCGTTSKGDAFANDGTDTLDPAESVACTATYVVTQSDVEAGQINNTATANGMGPNQTPVSAQDTANVPVAQTPALAIDKTLVANADEDASGDVSLNDTLTYGFKVTNIGTIILTGVVVTDPLPGLDSIQCAAGFTGTLAPAEAVDCTATYVVTQADVDAGKIDNTATADSNQTSSVQDSHSVPINTPLLGSIGDRVWSDVNANGVQDHGESGLGGVAVTLRDANGNTVATAVTGTDGTYRFDNLAAGTYTLAFALPAAAGHYFSPQDNSGGNDSVDSDVDPNTGQTAQIVLGLGENDTSWDAGIFAPPVLDVQKSDNGITVKPGETITYTLQYTNTGRGDATNVVITEIVPEHTRADLSASTSGWQCENGNITAGTVCTFQVAIVPAQSSNTTDLIFVVQVDTTNMTDIETINNLVTIADDGTHGRDPNVTGQASDTEDTPVDTSINPAVRPPTNLEETAEPLTKQIYMPVIVSQ